MKTRFFLSAWLSIALTLSLSGTVYGDDDRDGEHECDQEGQGTFNAVVVLSPTTNAPAGARGVAKLEAEQDDDETEAELELKLFGLGAGKYQLSVTRQSDGTNIALGTITIGNHHEDGDEDGDEEGDDDDQGEDHDWGDRWDGDSAHHWIGWSWGGFTNWGGWTNWSITNWCNATNRATVVEAEVDLPAGLDPADIAQIILSDTNGLPILVGDLVKPARASVINMSASARVVAGAASPTATGVAQVRSTAMRGKWKHQFSFQASGFDSKKVLRVYVNQKKAGGTRSNKSGQVLIRKVPSRTPAIRSVQLLDAKGNEVARVRF